jgi:hypothetical protein
MSLYVDRKVLHSQFNRNNLQIHCQLVRLYVNNLNSLATISALIARLSFNGLQQLQVPGTWTWQAVDYLYCLISMVALLTALMTLSQATISLLCYPMMFLFGETKADSVIALIAMRQQQQSGLSSCCTCVALILLQALVFSWSVTPFPLSCALTLLQLCGSSLIFFIGRQTIQEFTPSSLPLSGSEPPSSQHSSSLGSSRSLTRSPNLREIIRRARAGSGSEDGVSSDHHSTAEMKNMTRVEEIDAVRDPSLHCRSYYTSLSLSVCLSVSLCLCLCLSQPHPTLPYR